MIGRAKIDKPPRLSTGGTGQRTGENHRLVGDDPDRMPVDACKPGYENLGPVGLDLEEAPRVDKSANYFFDIVGPPQRVRQNRVEVDGFGIGRLRAWRIRPGVAWQIGQEGSRQP